MTANETADVLSKLEALQDDIDDIHRYTRVLLGLVILYIAFIIFCGSLQCFNGKPRLPVVLPVLQVNPAPSLDNTHPRNPRRS